MFSELLASLFFGEYFVENRSQVYSKPQVLVEVKIKPTPQPSHFEIPTDLEKPSPPPPSKKPKASLNPKASVEVKGMQILGINTQSVLKALNEYRQKNGVGALTLDSKLQEYAQSRANHLKSLGKLDKHAGHKAFMKNNGFEKLGFGAVAENQSWNFKGDGQGLIEDFYRKSSGHNKNQLSSEYSHVGIGISGIFTNLVFGGKKK